MDDEDSMLQLMYRKDGIANLDVITLVAKVVDIARVSMCVCVCMRTCVHGCVSAYVCACVRAFVYIHAL